MSHTHERVTFDGTAGALPGTLRIPGRRPDVGVVLAHCFTCSKSLKVTRALATGIEDGGHLFTEPAPAQQAGHANVTFLDTVLDSIAV